MNKKLTDLEKDYLNYIENYIKIKGYPPSIRDISKNMYVSIATAHRHLTTLVDKGYLRYTPKISRSYTPDKRYKGSA